MSKTEGPARPDAVAREAEQDPDSQWELALEHRRSVRERQRQRRRRRIGGDRDPKNEREPAEV
ncbi:MAG: hypothetical protein ACYC28_13310 [Longimicrobiales bacterium]